MASKLSVPLEPGDLANDDPLVEIDSAAFGMTDALCYGDDAYGIANDIEDITRAKGIGDFNIRDFSVAIETSLTTLFRDSSLRATGRQYAFTRAATTEGAQEPLQVLPETVRATLPPKIAEGMKRLGLEVTIVPLPPVLPHVILLPDALRAMLPRQSPLRSWSSIFS